MGEQARWPGFWRTRWSVKGFYAEDTRWQSILVYYIRVRRSVICFVRSARLLRGSIALLPLSMGITKHVAHAIDPRSAPSLLSPDG